VRYLIVAVIASAITVFALQNTTPISVQFHIWSLPETALATVIVVSVVAGIVLVGLPLGIGRWRLRARARHSKRAWRPPRRTPPNGRRRPALPTLP
jgi:uncharacterized integral membrane protein